MPWRNGAGTTREIVREPARGETFDWRLSLASLTSSGPFSAYPGHTRAVALVDGRGFRLKISGARERVLCSRGEHALFSGAAQTDCELLDGTCTDLSLMVREPGRISAVTRLRIGDEQLPAAAAGTIQALFVLHGAIECRAREPSLPGCAPAARPYTLNYNDTFIICCRGHCWSLKQAANEIAELLLIAFAPAGGTHLAKISGARADAPANT